MTGLDPRLMVPSGMQAKIPLLFTWSIASGHTRLAQPPYKLLPVIREFENLMPIVIDPPRHGAPDRKD
jgi:hypothetical protein